MGKSRVVRPQTSDASSPLWRHPLLLLLAVVGVIYLVNYNGLLCTNDGSHFALIRAIAERGTFELTKADAERYTAMIDYAVGRDGRYFSDRPPGTAFLLTPFYCAGLAADSVFGFSPGVREQVLRFCATTGIYLLALLNVALIYWGARMLGAARSAAILAAMVFALAGLQFRYATLMFSHTPSVTATLLGACLLLANEPTRLRPLYFLGVGLLLGYAVLIEYQNAVFSAVYGVAWLARLHKKRDWGGLGAMALGAALCVVVLAGYHWINFGNPWRTTHAYNPAMPHNQHIQTIFGGNMVNGLNLILVGPNGVLLFAPIFLIGAVGLAAAVKHRPQAWPLLLAMLAYSLVISKHTTILGGGTRDCRYFFPVTALMSFGIATAWQWARSRRSASGRLLLAVLLCTVSAFSVYRSVNLNVYSKAVAVPSEFSPAKKFWWKYSTLLWRPPQLLDIAYHQLFRGRS